MKSSGTEKYIIHTKPPYLLLEIDNDTTSQRCGHESISKAMNYPLVPISDATDKMSTFQSEGPLLQHLWPWPLTLRKWVWGPLTLRSWAGHYFAATWWIIPVVRLWRGTARRFHFCLIQTNQAWGNKRYIKYSDLAQFTSYNKYRDQAIYAFPNT